jgi:hypothetical protein
MHSLNDRSRLSTVTRLADIASSRDGQQLLRLLAHLSLPTRADDQAGSGAPDMTPPDPNAGIGIWSRTIEHGRTTFVRAASAESRRFWADVDRIAPADGSRPVVLLGESVARGYYYDPHYNPAAAMASMIARDPALRDVEVVDLARVDCSRDMLLQLARESLAIRPAAWVLFAGNNWNPFLDLEIHQYHDISAKLAVPSAWPAVRAYIEAACRAQAAAFFRRLGCLSKAHAIPVVVVVPEFNLLDWRNEYGASIPLLGGFDAVRWHRLRQAAEAALAQQRWDTVADLADSMLALDGGGAPRTYELLAHCRLAEGACAEARHLFEKARDAGLSIPVRRSPRCFAVVQEALRTEAAAHGLACVDLPARLQEYANGGLPDHRLFHDYCHLTADGIRVAMAHTVSQLGPLLGGSRRTWQDLYDGEPEQPPFVLAEAHLMAAIHNARWGQSAATIHQQCARAVAHAPDIVETMTQCLDTYIRRAPSVLCGSFDMLARRQRLSAVNFVSMTGDPRREKLLNPTFVETMIDVLSTLDPDAAVRARDVLVSEHGLTSRRIDLLATSCCCTSCADPEYGWLQRSGIFKAHGIRSTFTFLMQAPAKATSRLTYRVPGPIADEDGTIGFELNGVTVASLTCAHGWHTATVALDPALLRVGWNTITLQWPQPSWSGDVQVQRIVSSLEAGEVPEFFPSYGELHAFTAAAACASCA